MARYGAVWLEIALAQYDSLPAMTRRQVDVRLEELLEVPRLSGRPTTSLGPPAQDGPAARRVTLARAPSVDQS